MFLLIHPSSVVRSIILNRVIIDLSSSIVSFSLYSPSLSLFRSFFRSHFDEFESPGKSILLARHGSFGRAHTISRLSRLAALLTSVAFVRFLEPGIAQRIHCDLFFVIFVISLKICGENEEQTEEGEGGNWFCL